MERALSELAPCAQAVLGVKRQAAAAAAAPLSARPLRVQPFQAARPFRGVAELRQQAAQQRAVAARAAAEDVEVEEEEAFYGSDNFEERVVEVRRS